MNKNTTLQLFIASFLCLSGVALLFWGFYEAPRGVIDSSILIGFGEIMTFAGSLLGIDYHYKFRTNKKDKDGEL